MRIVRKTDFQTIFLALVVVGCGNTAKPPIDSRVLSEANDVLGRRQQADLQKCLRTEGHEYVEPIARTQNSVFGTLSPNVRATFARDHGYGIADDFLYVPYKTALSSDYMSALTSCQRNLPQYALWVQIRDRTNTIEEGFRAFSANERWERQDQAWQRCMTQSGFSTKNRSLEQIRFLRKQYESLDPSSSEDKQRISELRTLEVATAKADHTCRTESLDSIEPVLISELLDKTIYNDEAVKEEVSKLLE